WLIRDIGTRRGRPVREGAAMPLEYDLVPTHRDTRHGERLRKRSIDTAELAVRIEPAHVPTFLDMHRKGIRSVAILSARECAGDGLGEYLYPRDMSFGGRRNLDHFDLAAVTAPSFERREGTFAEGLGGQT